MPENNKITKLIAVYARVSTARQEEDGTIETQLSAVREFAAKNGYAIVREYIDNGWSGDSLARPQLDELRQDAKEKIWDAVLMYDPDRLARRYSYQELVMDELKETGVEILFVTISSPKNSEDKILYGVRGLFAEYERAKISERFRLGKLRKVREGHVLVSEAPYGYDYIPRKDNIHGHYLINEEETKTVRMIFNFVVNEGLTLRGIVRRLQELGIKPRKSKRGVWNTSTLCNLLRNEAYIGDAHYGASYAVVPENPTNTEKYRKIKKTSRKIKSRDEWIMIPVPAIIDRELFMRAQQQMKDNFALSKRSRKNDYLLSGRLWCSCGARRTGEGSQNGKYLSYRCGNRVNRFPLPATCEERGVNVAIADKIVWDRLLRFMTSPELLLKASQKRINKREDKVEESSVVVDETRKEIAGLKEERDRYTKLYGRGIITINELEEHVTPVRDRIALLEDQIAKVDGKRIWIKDTLLPKAKDINNFAAVANKWMPVLNFEEKQAIVRNVVEKIITKGNELHISGEVSINTTNINNGFCSLHRHRRASECRKVHSVQGAHQKRSAGGELSVCDHRSVGRHRYRSRRPPRRPHKDKRFQKDHSGDSRIL